MRGYPTFVLADAAGEEIDRLVGYGGVPDFVRDLGAALADPTTVAQKEARHRASPTARDAALLGRILGGRGEVQPAVAYYRQAQELDPGADYAYPIFETVAMGFRKQLATADELKAAAAAALASPRAEPGQLLTVGYLMSAYARRFEDPALRSPYLELALAATADITDPELLSDRRDLLVDEALFLKRDAKLAVRLRKEALPDGWRDDPRQLNRFAWWCFDHKINLKEAEKLARRGVKLAAGGDEKAMVLDTLAEIRAARGDPAEAARLAAQAAAADPGNAEYPKQVERFQKAAGKEAGAD